MRLPSPSPFPIQWICDLPPVPSTHNLLNDPSVAFALSKLRGAKFSLPHLIVEGLMFPFGISNIDTPLDGSFADALLPAFMYKNPTMTKSFVNNLGEEWLRIRRANPNSSTLGLLSKEEQQVETVAAMEEEEEQPFVALIKKPRLTENVPFGDLFGTFVQAPLVPTPFSLERGKQIFIMLC
ncbi:uncharacterized protein LOC121987411 [Zingiber officinale]|uniref:uncharacterized protein LOC121987411 n=1 Tax=Zingiber officinale TaxID=94328 RepID=UPI001C4CD4EB|nr:uncharacterized protein LOC121987411 [Zingiber officinale]